MMFNIKSIYQRIHDKLNLWTRFKKLRMKLSHDHVNEEGKHEMKEMKEKLEDLNCNNAANAEICHLVASFFVSIFLFTFCVQLFVYFFI